MNITVIVATHKEYRMPEDQCYLPLHVGREGKEDIGFCGDNTGENISEKNPYYCELTGLYWMWKNIDADYKGMVHYRRHFRGKQGQDKFECIMTEEEFMRILRKTDIILPKKRRYYIESLYSHYAHTHYAEHLELTREILAKQCPAYLDAFDKALKRTSGHMFNMFVMSKEKCDQYCNWLFPILFELEKEIDIKSYNDFQARLFGRISELLMDVWIANNHFSYEEVPVLVTEKINWFHKGVSFLRAKFSGKKYDASF